MGVLTQLGVGHLFAREYRVIAPLAEGGMGAVYVAEQLSTGKRRALKVMLPALVQDERARERFTQEARMGSHIESEHVVEVVGAGVDEPTGMPWLAMELLEGQDLNAAIRQRGPIAPAEAYEIIQQIGEGLGAAHARGIVHRDLKPENVFIAVSRRRGVPFTVKILDFGIAKLTQESRTGASATAAVGSPMWMAPEQTEQHARLRPATDVWALGLVVFHMLTGRFYWRVANQPEVRLTALFTEVLVSPIEPPSMRAAELGVSHLLPAGFDAWFLRCVERDPDRRFADARVAVAALTPQLTLRDGAHVMVPPTIEQPQVRRGVAPTMPMTHPQQAVTPGQLPVSHAQGGYPPAAHPQGGYLPGGHPHLQSSHPQGGAYAQHSYPQIPGNPGGQTGAPAYVGIQQPLPHQSTTPYAVHGPSTQTGALAPRPAGRGALYALIAVFLLVGTGVTVFGGLYAYQTFVADRRTGPVPAGTDTASDAGAAMALADAATFVPSDAGAPDAGPPDAGAIPRGVEPPRERTPRERTPREPATSAFDWGDGSVRRWRGTWSGEGWRYALTFELNRNGREVTGTVTWRLQQAGDPSAASRVGDSSTEWVRGTYDTSTGALALEGYGVTDATLIQPDHYRLRVASSGALSGATTSDGGRVTARAD